MIKYKIKKLWVGYVRRYQILIRNCCLFGGWDKLNDVCYETPQKALTALAEITHGCPCKIIVCKD